MHSGRGASRLFSATGWLGVALAVAGAACLIVGWWGISGESVVALQMSYLASATIPGAALVIGGAVLLSGESARREAGDSARMIATLYDLLTEASAPSAGASPPADEQTLVVVPGGSRYHRADCALVAGKAGAVPVDAAAIAGDAELQPCPVCNPPATDP